MWQPDQVPSGKGRLPIKYFNLEARPVAAVKSRRSDPEHQAHKPATPPALQVGETEAVLQASRQQERKGSSQAPCKAISREQWEAERVTR